MRVAGLLGRDPCRAGACHRGDELGGLGHVLAVDDHGSDDAEYLLAQPLAHRLEVRELLGAQHEAYPGRAGTTEQAGDMPGGDGDGANYVRVPSCVRPVRRVRDRSRRPASRFIRT